jgi:signal peptidase I
MTSDEHGTPDRATGAQGAEGLTDGVSLPGSQDGYSALAGWDATDPAATTAAGSAATGFTAGTDSTMPLTSDRAGAYVPRHGASRGSSGQVPDSRTGPADGWRTGPADGSRTGPADGWPARDDAPTADASQDGGDSEDADEAATSRKRRGSGWRELPILIVVALTIALVIKTFVVQPFFIPSSSMEDTLMVGDKVLVNKLVYHFRSIEPGDIIVFNGDGSWNPNPPAATPASNPVVRVYDDTLGRLFDSIAGLLGTPIGQTDYIKRVIGVPGDHVVCCNAQGLVTVNGVPLHEQSYLYPGAAPSTIRFNIVVPPGRLWVMGDNRLVSDDSRLRQSDPGGGTIPENKVIGRAFVIIWPPSQWRILPIPSTFDQAGIDKPRSAAAGEAASAAAVNRILGAQVRPEPPYFPLAAGAVIAVPLTWLQRRARRRLAERLRQRRRHRHS